MRGRDGLNTRRKFVFSKEELGLIHNFDKVRSENMKMIEGIIVIIEVG